MKQEVKTIQKQIGRRVRQLRELHNMRQSDLCKVLSVSHAAVSLWEGGKRKLAACDLIFMSRHFKIPPNLLLENLEDPNYLLRKLKEKQ